MNKKGGRKNTTGVFREDFETQKEYMSTLNKALRKRNRRVTDREKLARGCAHCPKGTFWLPPALEFHHIDPSTKDSPVSSLANSGAPLKKVGDEVKKCIVLCANHHRELHYIEKS